VPYQVKPFESFLSSTQSKFFCLAEITVTVIPKGFQQDDTLYISSCCGLGGFCVSFFFDLGWFGYFFLIITIACKFQLLILLYPTSAQSSFYCVLNIIYVQSGQF